MERDLAEGRLHPRDAKMKLAFEIVSIYHSPQAAEQAQREFIRVFQQGDLPEEMEEYRLLPGQTVLDVVSTGFDMTKSEVRRLLEQKGVRLDGKPLSDGHAPFPGTGVLQVGKRKYLRIK